MSSTGEMTSEQRVKAIRQWNDIARRYIDDPVKRQMVNARVMLTGGIVSLPLDTRVKVYDRVKKYENFNSQNDPYGEHDFGSFNIDGVSVIWKFDYYDLDMEHGSEDPCDLGRTIRVLTIMTGEEY